MTCARSGPVADSFKVPRLRSRKEHKIFKQSRKDIKYSNKAENRKDIKYSNKAERNIKYSNKEERNIKYSNKAERNIKYSNKAERNIKYSNKVVIKGIFSVCNKDGLFAWFTPYSFFRLCVGRAVSSRFSYFKEIAR